MKCASSILGVVLGLFAVGTRGGPVEIEMTGTNSVKLDWEAVPEKTYQVVATPDLVVPSWTNLTPEGVSFTNVIASSTVPASDGIKYFRIAQPDLDPPEIVELVPASNAVAVATNASVYIELADASGIATQTLVLSIAGWTNIGAASPYLSWSNSTVVFTPPAALGEPGATISNSLTIADTLGHTLSNYTWSFELERTPEVTGEFLALTAPDASKRTANGRLRTLPNVKPRDSSPTLQIVDVTSNVVVFSYEDVPPTISNGTRLVSFDAAYPFYRAVISNVVDAGLLRITAWTEDISLTNLLAAGSFGAVQFAPADPGLSVRDIGADVNLLHAEFGDDLGGTILYTDANLKLWLPECNWALTADVDVAAAIGWSGLESFDASARSELTIHIKPEALFYAAIEGGDECPLVEPISKMFGGMIGPVPVWIEVCVELNASYEYDASAAGNAHTVVDMGKELEFTVQMFQNQWTHGFRNPPIVLEAEPITWQLEGNAHVKVYVQPKLTVQAYGLAGLWADIVPYTEYEGSFQLNPLAYDWALYFGLSSTLGIESRIWDANAWGEKPEWTLFDERWPLWSTNYPDPSTIPVFSGSFPNRTVPIGGSVTLFGWAAGIPEPQYRWYFNGSRIVGASQPEYTIRQANAGYAGTYAVQAYNDAGTAQTSCAVNVCNSYILSQPLVNAAANVNRTQGVVTWQGRTEEGIWADADDTFCARFTRMCFGEFTGRFDTAIDMYEHFSGLNLVRAGAGPPAAALVFYGRHDENTNCGHVGIADGQGKLYSVVNRTSGVLLRAVTGTFQAAYLGYVTAQDFKTYHSASSYANTYMVVDLSGGPSASSYPVSYLSAVPAGGWSDEYKTTKLVLRHISAGTFTMGSPANELGRYSIEPLHQVSLTEDFYIGVFEVTQKQWERVMGNWPSYFSNATYRATRPVEQVSYYEIRENPANIDDPAVCWPNNSIVNENSFMGKLRAKTEQAFDLPTEAQWEYACRAGTTTALNSGYNLTNTSVDAHVAAVGRYWYNGGSNASANGNASVGSAEVGSFLPNAWGLYDMHGNVWEWCLDWYTTSPAGALNPQGPATGSDRVNRGGRWNGDAQNCRSANRNNNTPESGHSRHGLRVCLPLDQ